LAHRVLWSVVAVDGEPPGQDEEQAMRRANPGVPVVCLFHEEVAGAEMFGGAACAADARVTRAFLARYDAALGGHIHLRQALGPRAAYCGSLVQQNIGEARAGHGYLLWTVAAGAASWLGRDVANPRGYLRVEVGADGADQTPGPLPDAPLYWELVYEAGAPGGRVAEVAGAYEARYLSPPRAVRAKRPAAGDELAALPAGSAAAANEALAAAQAAAAQGSAHEEILRALVADEKGEDWLADSVVETHRARYPAHASVAVKGGRVRVTRFEFDNVYAYGPGNVVDFAAMEGRLSGVVAPNHTGKSSLVEALLFALYEEHPRTPTKKDVIHRGAKSCRLVLDFELDGRAGRIEKGFNSGSQHAASRYRFSYGGENRTKGGTPETLAEIAAVVGRPSAALATSFQLQGGEAGGFMSANPGGRKRLLADVLALGSFEALAREVARDLTAAGGELRALERVAGDVPAARAEVARAGLALQSAAADDARAAAAKADAAAAEDGARSLVYQGEAAVQTAASAARAADAAKLDAADALAAADAAIARAEAAPAGLAEAAEDRAAAAHRYHASAAAYGAYEAEASQAANALELKRAQLADAELGAQSAQSDAAADKRAAAAALEATAPGLSRLAAAQEALARAAEELDRAAAKERAADDLLGQLGGAAADPALERPSAAERARAAEVLASWDPAVQLALDGSVPDALSRRVAAELAAARSELALATAAANSAAAEEDRLRALVAAHPADPHCAACRSLALALAAPTASAPAASLASAKSAAAQEKGAIARAVQVLARAGQWARLDARAAADAAREATRRAHAAAGKARDLLDQRAADLAALQSAATRAADRAADSIARAAAAHERAAAARGDHDAASDRAQTAAAKLTLLADDLAARRAALDRADADLAAAIAARADADAAQLARADRPRLASRASDLAAAAASAAAELSAASAALAARRGAWSRAGAALLAADAAASSAAASLAAADRDLARARLTLDREVAASAQLLEASRRHAVLKAYRAALRPEGGIGDRLLEQGRAALEFGINAALRELGARFRAFVEPSYEVCIDAPGDQRLPSSLGSGYQKFVLSLAARLAVWRLTTSARPDAMIIDEGFGACDDEYLDAMGSALENLAAAPDGPRLVFLVSHVDALKIRLDRPLEITPCDSGNIIGRLGRSNAAPSAPAALNSAGSAGASFAGASPAGASSAGASSVTDGASSAGDLVPDLANAGCLYCNACDQSIRSAWADKHLKSAKHAASVAKSGRLRTPSAPTSTPGLPGAAANAPTSTLNAHNAPTSTLNAPASTPSSGFNVHDVPSSAQPSTQTGPQPSTQTGPQPSTQTGPQPNTQTGPQPSTQAGPQPSTQAGPQPSTQAGPQPSTQTGPQPSTQTGPQPSTQSATIASLRRSRRAVLPAAV
jgi:DNA repair exonuclease SbcCD ATPase subunit